MRIALVTTVKNEAALLAANLRYHHWLGVERAWVFIDGSTDGTPGTLAGLPFVEVHPSARPGAVPAALRDHPRIRALAADLDGYHTVRQMLDMVAAADAARRAGFDWIVGLDPDELIAPDPVRLSAGALRDALADVPAEVESLRLLPLELIPGPETQQGLPFERARLFKNMFRKDGGRYRPAHTFPRPLALPGVADPRLGETYFGQIRGKTLLRLSVDAFPWSVHGWRRLDGDRIPDRQVLWLHHYCNASFEQFRDRLRMRRTFPEVYPSGAPANARDLAWHRMVHDPRVSLAELRAYYDAHIAVTDAEVRAWRAAAPGSVVDVPSIGVAMREDVLRPA